MRALFIAAIVLVSATGFANATTDTENLRDWVRLDSEIQRATQALASDPNASRPAVEELLKRVDTINGASDLRPDESALSRAKRYALRGPLYNLRLALEQPEMASRISKHAVQPRGPLMSAQGVAGVGCEQAIELVPGRPMHIEVPTNGSRWIAVRSPLGASAPLAVTTVGSVIDAAVKVYADCRDTGKPAISSGDDNYGLQAIALLPPAAHPLMVELRNQGERGIAMVDAITAVTINGRITRIDTGSPLRSYALEAYRGANPGSVQYAGQATSQSNGDYQLVTYSTTAGPNTYVRTKGPYYAVLYLDKAWDNITCSQAFALSDCGPGTPSPVATDDGVTVSNVNLALSPGGAIYGQILDHSGVPIDSAQVSISQAGASSTAVRNVYADAAGRYRVAGLVSGQYRVVASAIGYKSQVFAGFDCDITCDQIPGTPVATVEFGQSLASFSLSRGNSIVVSTTVGGQPTANFYLQVIAVNPAGNAVSNAGSGGSGAPVLLGPLPAGTYRVRVEGGGLVSEYYQDVLCAAVCGAAEFQAATPIALNNDAPPVAISMDLERVPEITGVVTGAGGSPIANATVTIFRNYSQQTTQTASDGSYRIRPPALGSYMVHAGTANHIDELYDDLPCNNVSYVSNCIGGTPIIVSAGTSPAPVNFQLAPSAKIRGQIGNLPAFTNFQIVALNAMNLGVNPGRLVQQGDGNYELSDLPEGQFRFVYWPGSFSRFQVYDGIDCGPEAYDYTQCPLSNATPVSLVSGANVDGINFRNRSRIGRLGQVTDAGNGLPLAGIIVDVFDPQSGDRVGSAISDADGRIDIAPNSSPGSTFALATDNYRGYINEVYNNIECPVGSAYLGTCSLAGATTVTFPGDGSELSIALRPSDVLFRSGFE